MKHLSVLVMLICLVILGVTGCSKGTEIREGSIGIPVVANDIVFTVINVDERIYEDYSEGDFRDIAIPFRLINQSETSVLVRPEDFHLIDGNGAIQQIRRIGYPDQSFGATELPSGQRLLGKILTGSEQPIEELKLEYSSDLIPKGLSSLLVKDKAARQLSFTSDELTALIFEEGDYHNATTPRAPIIIDDEYERPLYSTQHTEYPSIFLRQVISEKDDASYLTVVIYGYASLHSVESAFYNLTPFVSPIVDDVGEIAKYHDQEGESEVHSTRMTFTRCHVFVEIGGSNDENGATHDEVVQYSKKLDKRLKKVVCR